MARTFNNLTPPADGQEIGWHAEQDRLEVPDRPIIPFIEGDGTGPDIWRATRHVLDGAVAKLYGGGRSIACSGRCLRPAHGSPCRMRRYATAAAAS